MLLFLLVSCKVDNGDSDISNTIGEDVVNNSENNTTNGNENINSVSVTNSSSDVSQSETSDILLPGLYPSNSIGQVRKTSTDNYYLRVESDTESVLQHSGNIIKRYITTKNGKITNRQEIDNGGKTNIYKYDENGNMFEHTDENGNVEKLLYDSSSRLISMTTFNDQNEEIGRSVYYRDPKNGEVLGIRNNDTYSFFTNLGESSLYVIGKNDDFDTYETFFGSITFRTKNGTDEDYTAEKEGDNLVISLGSNKIVYSKDGQILEDNGVKYHYNSNNILDYTEEDANGVHIKEYYEDAIKTIREETVGTMMIKRTLYYSTTQDVELFERGKKYATVTYDGDGIKVLRVNYV